MILQTNENYIHISSGNTYELLMLTNETAKNNRSFVPTVVFEDKQGVLWSRPISEFLEKFKAI
jgi:hypothetical protein